MTIMTKKLKHYKSQFEFLPRDALQSVVML